MLYFLRALLKVPVREAYKIVEVRAKATTMQELMVETIVVARLPQREKRARKPTRISTIVEMRAMMKATNIHFATVR